jgi:hypothetical protein
MLHFLLIILILLLIWKLLSHRPVNRAALLTGLGRLALVLAILGAALGGLVGYAVTSTHTCQSAAPLPVPSAASAPDPNGFHPVPLPAQSDECPANYGAITLGIVTGFIVVWLAAAVLIWIVRGFLA